MERPTGTITFLFTDIEGSTRQWETHPTQMRSAIARHDALLREAVAGQGGYLFKTMGDGIAAAFATAPAALLAALEAQRAIRNEGWPEPVSVKVRMGLHTGAAEMRDDDYFGPALNRTVRLMSAGHGGQVLLSESAQQLARDTLPPGVGMRNLGEHRLKDLIRPETVYQATHATLTESFPALRTLDNPASPNNLPQLLTSFVGREAEIARVSDLLSKLRLLTLTGSGGSGKTRLSLQVAAEMLEEYPDGVWLVELAPLSDPAQVPQSVASVLGIREQPGRTVALTLADALREKRLLLLLDNAEHLVEACASLVAALLRSCAGVKAMVTSREPLGIGGETTYRVPALSLPDPERRYTFEALTQYESVRLFIERTQAVMADFAVSNANAPALAQLCFRLGGIPLAIELAAARIRSLAVEQINERLDSRFRLLTGGDRSALPRQQTLRALIDWSYDLLGDSEKTLFARLSVFAGGWTLEAAESVCGGEPLEEWEVLDLLGSLVDKSLVPADGDETASRYRLLETLREYASEKLAATGTASVISDRHVDWCLGLAEKATLALEGPDAAAALKRLETERDNLRAAFAWCEAVAQDGGRYARLAGAVWRLWHMGGYLAEGRERLERALEDVPREGEPAPARLRVRLLFGAGNVTQTQGDYAAAEGFYEEALRLGRALDDEGIVAIVVGSLGNIAWDRNDMELAHARYEQTLATYRRLGDMPRIAWALSSLANVASRQGDDAGAQASYEESLAIYRKEGNPINVAWVLGNLGDLLHNLGNVAAARASYREGLAIAHGMGLKPRTGVLLSNLGLVSLDDGDPYRALVTFAAVHALRNQFGIVVPPLEQARTDRGLDQARTLLGEEAFAEGWAIGGAFDWTQAAEYALNDPVQ